MSITSESPALSLGQVLAEHFRCPRDFAGFSISGDLSQNSGFFLFGPGRTCYGRCSSGAPAKDIASPLHDASAQISIHGAQVELPFNPDEVVDNLRLERYCKSGTESTDTLPANQILRNIYYAVRPLMPVPVRKHLQKFYFRGWDKVPFPAWPVDCTVENIFARLLILSMRSRNINKVPFIWFWPEGASSCTMMTHDVETSRGLDFSPELMDLDNSFGIKSSFQIIPKTRYQASESFLDNVRSRGFEVNIHDLNHDGKLTSNREEFWRSAKEINSYGKRFGALGFRSAVLYRNVEWYEALDFSYDMSLPNVAHLDPQQGGCCTVFPFFIGKILELPLTTTQDYSLFHILNDYSTRLWKEQIDLIRAKHGMISFNVHPDYITPAKARRVYIELLQYLRALQVQGETWLALPGEVSEWWRLRSELTLAKVGSSWQITGKGRERARLAYAVFAEDALTFEFPPQQEQNV